MTVTSDILIEAEQDNVVFSSEKFFLINRGRIPRHIAIIMDGNRRWALQNGLSPIMGHWKGAEILTDIVRAAAQLGVETLTVYAFSTENWGRSDTEVEALMNLFEVYLERKRDLMVREGIKLDAIGDLSRLPPRVQAAFQETKKATENSQKINLVLALNYGARDEIRRAVVKILDENERLKKAPQEITEEYIARHLDTNPWGDPELMIRTSGELRVSNFLLWQICYSEIFVTDVLWPDFSPNELFDAILSFQTRRRRYGG